MQLQTVLITTNRVPIYTSEERKAPLCITFLPKGAMPVKGKGEDSNRRHLDR